MDNKEIDQEFIPIPRFRPQRKPEEWKKDPYTFKQYGAIKTIIEEGIMPESEVRQVIFDMRNDNITKGQASVILDKYMPLLKKLKRQQAEGCTITDPHKIREIQDQLLEESAKKQERAAKRRERGACIKE